MRKYLVFMLLVSLVLSSKAQRVSNVTATQEGQKLRIQYELSTASPTEVGLYISENNGSTWSKVTQHLSGDVGPMVSGGSKEMVWDVLQTRENLVGNAIVFKVKVGSEIKSVKIGNQVWMAENLNVDHYRNGDPIPTGLSNTQWMETKEGASAFYKDDPSYVEIYGKLYNWYAVNDSRGLCPIGWHVPTKSEWLELQYYFGNGDLLAKNLMALENHDRDNGKVSISGFDGFPSGIRGIIGTYGNRGFQTSWWSSTPNPGSGFAWSLHIDFIDAKSDLDYYSSKTTGLSVRCIKD